jgi:hypothetical protein
MKNFVKWFGIIALAAVIGSSFAACGDDGETVLEPTSAVYEGMDGDDVYKLEITKASGKAMYAPKTGDDYVLTITYKAGGTKTSTGTVTSFSVSIGFTLQPSNSEITFTVKIESAFITGITGTITLDDKTTQEVTEEEEFTPCKTYESFELNANKWENDSGESGEGMHRYINLLEFTSRKPESGDVLKFQISGKVEKTIIPLKWFSITLCAQPSDYSKYQWLGSSESVELKGTFNQTFEFTVWFDDPIPNNYDIYVSLANDLWRKNKDGEYTFNSGEKFPADTEQLAPVVTFSNFRISLLPDKNEEGGNSGNRE